MSFYDFERPSYVQSSENDCQSCHSQPISHVIIASLLPISWELHVCSGCAARYELRGWESSEIVKQEERRPYQDEWEEIYGVIPNEE